MKVSQKDFEILSRNAIRYCMGKLYPPLQSVIDTVKPHLKEVSDETIIAYISDLDVMESSRTLWSDPLDKPIWMEWKEAVEAEQKRRKKR